MDDTEKLWREFAKNKDSEIKEQLILKYAYLVKLVAGRLAVTIGSYFEFDDMVSEGIFGLIDAIDRFDYDKGVKFETYASLRIRGSILDKIRKLDWAPRSLRHKNKQLQDTFLKMEAELGREPTDTEMAERLGLTLQEIRELIRKSSVVSLVSLDDYMDQNHDGGGGKDIPSETDDTPERHYDKKETKQILEDAIKRLSEKERKVIALYYFERLTLKEISKLMEVTEPRVSQIHSKAIFKLNLRLGGQRLLFG